MIIECGDPAICQAIAEQQRNLILAGVEVALFVIVIGYIFYFILTKPML